MLGDLGDRDLLDSLNDRDRSLLNLGDGDLVPLRLGEDLGDKGLRDPEELSEVLS